MSHPFVFRPNTHDEEVFLAINTYHEYRLPERFHGDDVIIDIGSHIGSFCYAALLRERTVLTASRQAPRTSRVR